MPPLRHILIRVVLVILGVSLAMVVSCIAAYPFITFPAPNLGASPSAADLVSALILFPVTIVLVALQPFVTVAMIWQFGLIGVLASEVFSLRSWIFHVANGAGAAALSARSLSLIVASPDTSPIPLGFVAAGGLSGLVYWLIAGRSAGLRVAEPAAEAPQNPPTP